MKRLLYVLSILPALPAFPAPSLRSGQALPALSAAKPCGEIILATTTSTQDTGLLDSLVSAALAG
jgi:ABC-type tungstate transport system permease subunit